MFSLVLGRERRRRRVIPLELEGDAGGRELVEMGRIPKREENVQGEASLDGVMEDLEDSEVVERVCIEAEMVRTVEVEDVVEVVVERANVEDVEEEGVDRVEVEYVEEVMVERVEGEDIVEVVMGFLQQ